VGNEVTYGMLWPDGKAPEHWDNFADLLKAGIRGVVAGSANKHKTDARPRIMIHIERSGDLDAAESFLDKLIAYEVPFDVLGLSYYPRWHGSILVMSGNLRALALRYHRPMIVVETAYNWIPGGMEGKTAEFPESPEGQRDFLRAVDAAVRAIPNGLGQGVFWWEPAAEGGLRDRSFFDENGNALPVMSAIDRAD
jgi:arabinogalactan endo-1,4-beta-galactosidase